MPPYILLIDNDVKFLQIFGRRLRSQNYEVGYVTNGYDAVQSVQDRLPDLVILDIYMPDVSGLEVLQQLRRDDRSKAVPVLIMTSGHIGHLEAEFLSNDANDFLRKTSDKKVFLARVKILVDANQHLLPKTCVFSFDIAESVQYSLSGGISRQGQPIPLSINRASESTQIAFNGRRAYEYHEEWRERLAKGQEKETPEGERFLNLRREWRPMAVKQGQELYKKLFLDNGHLMEDWGRIQQAVSPVNERLTMRFGGSRENLAIPYELLHDDIGPLILRYPMSRQLDCAVTAKPSWQSVLQQAQGRSLSALIIAGHAGVVNEAKIVAAKLKEALAKVDIELHVDPPELSAPLTFSEAESWLEKRTHQIIHYAGHSAFDFERPENSHLLFLAEDQTERKMTTTRVHNLLLGSSAQFVFLSSCSGAEISNSTSLDANTYIGLLHAVIMAGVPAALGYRWPVVSGSARLFAGHFYDGLICYPTSLEHATWYARRRIAEAYTRRTTRFEPDGWDETWFSPMLIVQNPD